MFGLLLKKGAAGHVKPAALQAGKEQPGYPRTGCDGGEQPTARKSQSGELGRAHPPRFDGSSTIQKLGDIAQHVKQHRLSDSA
jgi:hypothetical protein